MSGHSTAAVITRRIGTDSLYARLAPIVGRWPDGRPAVQLDHGDEQLVAFYGADNAAEERWTIALAAAHMVLTVDPAWRAALASIAAAGSDAERESFAPLTADLIDQVAAEFCIPGPLLADLVDRVRNQVQRELSS